MSRRKDRPASRQEYLTITKEKKTTNKHTMEEMLKRTNVKFIRRDETVKTNLKEKNRERSTQKKTKLG